MSKSGVDLSRFLSPLPNSFVTTILPEEAEAILESCNDSNRPLKEERVKTYARDMKGGRWPLTNQGLGFDTEGRLRDGQHRLWACFEAKTPFTTTVLVGMADEAQRNIDKGCARSLADDFAMFSHLPDKRKPARWINALVMLVSRRMPAISYADAQILIEVYKEAIFWLVREGQLSQKLAAVQVEAALVFAYKTNPEKVHEFMLLAGTGAGLSAGHPAMAVRRYVLETASWRTDSPRARILKILKAARAHLLGESIEKLYATEDALDFFVKAYQGVPLCPQEKR